MKTADVRRLKPLEQFLYWCRERHAVHLRRAAGRAKPWTDDEVLRRYFFTNPYRENDKVTAWFRERVRGPLRDDPRVLFATVAFRWFNLPATAEVLSGSLDLTWRQDNLLLRWDAAEALKRLSRVRDVGGKVFTGAYMINSPAGEPKLEAIVRRVTNVWEARAGLERTLPGASLETAHAALTEFDGLGGFMAYEVVTDLRHTYYLEGAGDILTWCNPGPGCIRGLYRLAGEDWDSKGNNATAPPRPRDWRKRMSGLLAVCRRRLTDMPPFEMREVEHSLCEYDKYMRALNGDGRLKRTYKGG